MNKSALYTCRRKVRYFLTLLLGFAILLPCTATAATGVVVDFLTGNPVPSVTVTLKCDRLKFLHGSETIRTLSRVTDSAGRYEFSSLDLIGCQFMTFSPEKSGFRYLHLLRGNRCPDYGEQIFPAILCLVDESTLGEA